MLKIQDFKDHGYSVFRHTGIENDWAHLLLQKKITCKDTHKIKYFINVYFSDVRLWKVWKKMKPTYPRWKGYKSYTVKVQLYSGNKTFDISISHDKDWYDVGDIEEEVEQIWSRMLMDFDQHN